MRRHNGVPKGKDELVPVVGNHSPSQSNVLPSWLGIKMENNCDGEITSHNIEILAILALRTALASQIRWSTGSNREASLVIMPRRISGDYAFEKLWLERRNSFPVAEIVDADVGQFVLCVSDFTQCIFLQVVIVAKESVDFI
jgi:hypothetical protein